MLIYSENGGFGDKVEILGEEYKASEIKEFPEATLSSSAASRCGIVADSSEAVEAISRRYEKLMDCESYINGGMYINLDGTDDEKIALPVSLMTEYRIIQEKS